MSDGTCPSCQKNVDEPPKMNMGFLASGGAAERVVDTGPQPIAMWKPVVFIVTVYVTTLVIAGLTGNLKETASALRGCGILVLYGGKIWLFCVIARGRLFAAFACLIVPFLWLWFVSEYWRESRWAVCVGLMGGISVPISHYAYEVGRSMGI